MSSLAIALPRCPSSTPPTPLISSPHLSLSLGAFPPADRDRILDLLFSTKGGGLGLEVARYNIGGSGWDTPDAPNLRAGANVPAYAGPGGRYDWYADAPQRACLLGARDRGAHTFEAFSNSPPYWMTASGRASGHAWGWCSNLPKTAVGAFADYLVAVISHFRDAHGLHFSTIAPFNEPREVSWWAGTNQEGCRFTPRQQMRVVAALAARLRAAGLLATPATGGAGPSLVTPGALLPSTDRKEVKIAVSDENAVGRAASSLERLLSRGVRVRARLPRTRPADGRPPLASAGGVVASLDGLAPADLAAVGRVNTHGYSGGAASRRALAALASLAGLPVWMSEVGFGSSPPSHPASASSLAAHVAADINTMGAVGWVYWQAVEDADGGSWRGLLKGGAPLSSLPFRLGFSAANWWWAAKQALQGLPTAVRARSRAAAAEYGAPWWGLVQVSFSGRAGGPGEVRVSKQFHGLGQYSRAVRAGWAILEVPAERAGDTVAAMSPEGDSLAIIATNDADAPRPVAFDLGPFLQQQACAGAGSAAAKKAKGLGLGVGGGKGAPPGSHTGGARVSATRTDAGLDGEALELELEGLALAGGAGGSSLLEDTLPPRSVTTYVVSTAAPPVTAKAA